MKNYKIIIGWLYPELMSTYGDRGNIIALKKRCEWREIDVEIKKLDLHFNPNNLSQCDLLFMGGAQDREQKIVANDLMKKKDKLKKIIEDGIPGLFVCGAYQFLGKYYREADGTTINSLGILDLYTKSPKSENSRLIGNIAIRLPNDILIVGFENHGGRTYLGDGLKSLGKVVTGFGNNGEDQTEGVVYKNIFATYLHGPILPKNPELTDKLIQLSLEKKYKIKIELKKLDDTLENLAKASVGKKLNIKL